MSLTEADLEDGRNIRFNSIKQGFLGWSEFPKTSKGLLDAIKNVLCL
jgi:hypothetical protein